MGHSFARDFAPAEGWVASVERPLRQEVCLNGRWQFQPVALPPGYRRDSGEVPTLPPPAPDAWDATPIKIPSPWNVNTWGGPRRSGEGTEHPCEPGALYFPSYPAAWDAAEMGWLRRSFPVPDGWAGRRIVLHFEAVAGQCQVLVNGRPAGEHFDKYLPFELDVTSLVRNGADNELLVGVRAHALFNQRSPRYPKMRAPYPIGSETQRLAGIWQDVFLLGLPPVRVEDAFVKPLVDQDTLEIEVALRNDTGRQQALTLGGEVREWINLAGQNAQGLAMLSAPEPVSALGQAVLALPPVDVSLQPGQHQTLTIRVKPAGRLKLWAPGQPALYSALLTLNANGKPIDRRCVRFGWRQFTIVGPNLLLNGQKIQLVGDLLHPFGPYTLSRRYAWAWYRMIQDMGGNAVRLHAQIHPRHYLELADEMGLLVLDETALFGSSIALNFDLPAAWTRFAEHYDGLVLRDRNHPSVFGWSVGNELFAIFQLNQVSPADSDRWYAQLAELALRARRLDPTRGWISCDGDEDLRGRLSVWSKHFGHGTPLDRLPMNLDKPLMVGESGGSYYAAPAQLATFNGERAYESYRGRNEALAIDVYDNLVRMARPRLAYFSASETAWFGLEHLPFGYRDFTRLPNDRDGVFFTRPFQEGKPGIQPERLPPYVCTLNPGWDQALPLYKPLPMFEAQKAALLGPAAGPSSQPWAKTPPANDPAVPPTTASPTFAAAGFVGDRSGALFARLAALGVPFAQDAGAATSFLIVDADGLDDAGVQKAKSAVQATLEPGGVVLVLVGQPHSAARASQLLPAPVKLTDRPATALVRAVQHPWVAGSCLSEMYLAEAMGDRHILKRGLAGAFVAGGRVLLAASNTDWSLFNNRPETGKCAALVLYEHLVKPSGAALVERDQGTGKLAVCSIDWRLTSRRADGLWWKLLTNMGLAMGPGRDMAAAIDEKGALVRALAIGRFGIDAAAKNGRVTGAADLEAVLAKDFLGESATRPRTGAKAAGRTWAVVTSPSRDRFLLDQLKQDGPADAFAVCFSYWIKSPRALDDLLTAGPDAPRLTSLCYVSQKVRLFLNGREVAPARTEPADYRTLYVFDGLPLKKGWNHVLIQVASTRLGGQQPGTLAVRLLSSQAEFLQQIQTAADLIAEWGLGQHSSGGGTGHRPGAGSSRAKRQAAGLPPARD